MPVDLPVVDGAAGPIDGWHVLVPPGQIEDPLNPTEDELTQVTARCVAACEAHFSGNDALSANCSDPDAFDSPYHFYDGAAGPYDLVLAAQVHGEGVFVGQTLGCELGSTCCLAFDEQLCAATPARTTPANDLLGVGEEYRIALGTLSKVELVTNQGTFSSLLTGSIGYSFCRDGNAGAPCPFYLGSFEALARSNITASMQCADGTTARPTLSNFVVKLSQPAFGISAQGGTSRGFPRGALVLESAFDVGAQHVTTRRPSRTDVKITADATTFSANNLIAALDVPCNDSTATILAKFTIADPGNGTALGKPPVVTNTTAATGTCGAMRALAASVTDPNGDAGPVRWRVDGVLLAPGATSMIVSTPHTVEAPRASEMIVTPSTSRR